MTTALWWVRRDLWLADNQTLAAQLARCRRETVGLLNMDHAWARAREAGR